MKNWKPIFVENSKIPVWLSYIAPINIYAISIAPFVWCRSIMSPVTRRHETIHFSVRLWNLLFVGFYILYALSWLHGLWKYRDRAVAYRENVFEKRSVFQRLHRRLLREQATIRLDKNIGET